MRIVKLYLFIYFTDGITVRKNNDGDYFKGGFFEGVPKYKSSAEEVSRGDYRKEWADSKQSANG